MKGCFSSAEFSDSYVAIAGIMNSVIWERVQETEGPNPSLSSHLSFISQRLLTSSSLCFCALVTVGSRKLLGKANVLQWKTLSRWHVSIPHSSDSSLFLLPFDYITFPIFLSSFAVKREHDSISCKHTNSRCCFNRFIKTSTYWDEASGGDDENVKKMKM